MSKPVLLSAVVILVVVLGGVFFWMRSAGNMMTPSPTPAMTQQSPAMSASPEAMMPESSAATNGAMMGTVKEFTVEGSNFKFAPATLTVKKGDKVKITFNNTGGTHDWVLDGYNVSTKVISGGKSETVEFTADKAGTFEYYCSVGNHRQMGMKGTLTVQ